MSGSEERLKEELKELGDELRNQAVARSGELKDQAMTLGNELKDQAVARSSVLKDQAMTLGNGLKDQAVTRGSDFKDQAIDAAEWVRETASRTPKERWATLGSAGLALIALLVIARRLWTR
ncbi:MAG: hypothetical protein ACRDTG_23365 [Pseudonocardiaceae bacterium]